MKLLSTEDVIVESVKPAVHQQKIVLDQSSLKSGCLNQQGLCHNQTKANRSTPNSDCISSVLLTETAVDAQKMIAMDVGGGNETENLLTYTNFEFVANDSSNLSSQQVGFAFPPSRFRKATDLWDYWGSYGPALLYKCGSSSHCQNRIEAVVNNGRFRASTSELLYMKTGWFSGAIMDNVLELLLRQSGSTRAHCVIPERLASKWFYQGRIDDEDFESVRSWLSEQFIAAVNVHSSPEYRASDGKPNHWIFFSRGPGGVLHVYDSCGKENYYKSAFLRPFFTNFYEKLTGQLIFHVFDDDTLNNSNRKHHPIQQDSCSCGPIVLQEAERWLLEKKDGYFYRSCLLCILPQKIY